MPLPCHAKVVVAMVEHVSQRLRGPLADPAVLGGDWAVASGLDGADWEEVQPLSVDEPVLGEGEEGPSIGEEC